MTAVEDDFSRFFIITVTWAELRFTRQNETDKLTKEKARHNVPAISLGKDRRANSRSIRSLVPSFFVSKKSVTVSNRTNLF